MSRTEEDGEHKDPDPVLRGIVSDVGQLIERVPFARPWPLVAPLTCIAKSDAIPAPARHLLSQALRGRKSGVLIFGADAVNEHWAADLVDAALKLTEDAGPAARIMPRFRSHPAKDWFADDLRTATCSAVRQMTAAELETKGVDRRGIRRFASNTAALLA